LPHAKLVLREVVDFFRIVYAKLTHRPVAICDVGDVDGVASAAIFLRRSSNGMVILRAPAQLQRGRWYRLFTWDFVADLPCPPGAKVRMRADHHKTNPPCAEQECYDPSAPCAALLAAKLLGLEGDPIVQELVQAAIETDTANIVTDKVKLLDLAVRYSSYKTKLRIARKLAEKGIEAALQDEKIRESIERGLEAEKIIDQIAQEVVSRARGSDIVTLYFTGRLPISFRQLNIKIQKSNFKFVNILVKLGFRTYRLYCGADRDSKYDCTVIARALGGGGHKFAAGAQFKAPLLKPREGLTKFVNVLKTYLGLDRISLFIVDRDLNIREKIV